MSEGFRTPACRVICRAASEATSRSLLLFAIFSLNLLLQLLEIPGIPFVDSLELLDPHWFCLCPQWSHPSHAVLISLCCTHSVLICWMLKAGQTSYIDQIAILIHSLNLWFLKRLMMANWLVDAKDLVRWRQYLLMNMMEELVGWLLLCLWSVASALIIICSGDLNSFVERGQSHIWRHRLGSSSVVSRKPWAPIACWTRKSWFARSKALIEVEVVKLWNIILQNYFISADDVIVSRRCTHFGQTMIAPNRICFVRIFKLWALHELVLITSQGREWSCWFAPFMPTDTALVIATLDFYVVILCASLVHLHFLKTFDLLAVNSLLLTLRRNLLSCCGWALFILT